MGVTSDPKGMPSVVPTLRVLCLHGSTLTKDLLSLSLGPLKVAAKTAALNLELIFENGPHATKAASTVKRLDPDTLAMLGGPNKEIELFSWAHNNLASEGREYTDLDAALRHVQSLLRTHKPDGILGMSQGGNIAQVVAAQSATGSGYALKFSIHFGGCKPGWAKQKPELFADPLSCPAFICGGLADAIDGRQGDPGCKQMCALVHPDVLVSMTHKEGHRPFPADREAAAAISEALVAFMRKAQKGAFPKPPLPPVLDPTPAIGDGAGPSAPAVVDVTDADADAPSSPAEGPPGSMAAFLNEVALAHLCSKLCEITLEDAKAAVAASRTDFLKTLKDKGVDKLSDRQALANKLAKAVKEGSL